MAKKPQKNKKKNLKKAAKKAEKLLTRFKERFPELVQNSTAKDWAEVLLYVTLAYAGYEAFHHWRGSLLALVSLKLAESPSLTSSTAGLAGLGLVGLQFLAQGAPYSVEILGTGIKIPQMLPPPGTPHWLKPTYFKPPKGS